MKTLKHWTIKLSIACLVLTMSCLGGWIGQAIKAKAYPLDMVERVNLTPEIRPGDPGLVAQHVVRKQQCDVVVKRVIKTSSGQRMQIRQRFDEDFGPLGGDKYILPIPTDPAATLGPAEMYSKGYSWCSWLDYVLGPSEAEPWTMHFVFAENTVRDPTPESFSAVGVTREPKPGRGKHQVP